MKYILVAALIVLAGCNNKEKRFNPRVEIAAPAGPKQLRADYKRKVDSLKKVREAAIMNGKFSSKQQLAISDTIIKLQIQIDSLDQLLKK